MNQKTKFKQTEIGKIPEDWEVGKVGDFVDIKHGYAFSGNYFSDEPTNNILLTPGNFKIGGGFKNDKLKYTKEDPPTDYILKKENIIVTMTDLSKKGDTLGYSAKIPATGDKKYLHNQRVGLLKFKSNEIYPDFLYWKLRTKEYNSFIVGSATGSTVKHTSPNRIKQFYFGIPSLEEQKAIARTLSDLDAKIEINNQMNKTLEAIGQALFNRWLVDLEEIPQEWETKPLDKIAEFLNGLALQKYPVKDGEKHLPAIKIKELRSGVTEQTDKVSLHLPSEYIVENGDVLFSWSGSLEVVIWTHGKGALNQHLFKVSSKEYPKWFYYYWTRHYLSNFRHIAKSKATTMGHIQKHHISESQVLIPDEKAMKSMDKIMKHLLNKIIIINLEINNLIKIRDSLLPRLMSGEIRVK